MIPGASAGNVKQVPLGVINFFQIGLVTDRFYPLLQGNYFVVASPHPFYEGEQPRVTSDHYVIPVHTLKFLNKDRVTPGQQCPEK